MTRTVTATAVKRIITKGLTGWEAGKLVLQDLIDCYHHRDSVLTEGNSGDTILISHPSLASGLRASYAGNAPACAPGV